MMKASSAKEAYSGALFLEHTWADEVSTAYTKLNLAKHKLRQALELRLKAGAALNRIDDESWLAKARFDEKTKETT